MNYICIRYYYCSNCGVEYVTKSHGGIYTSICPSCGQYNNVRETEHFKTDKNILKQVIHKSRISYAMYDKPFSSQRDYPTILKETVCNKF